MSEPYWTDGQVTLHLGDCLDILPTLPAESVDAVICDPPYGLADLTLAKITEALSAWLDGDRSFVPEGAGGFMGKDWDRFVPPPAAWDECFRVMKPGAHLLAFAGTRTVDLMGLSIRLAGFEARDAVADLTGVAGAGLIWGYSQGFPKSLDVSKAIDKAAGTEREVVAEGAPVKRMIPGADQNRTGSWIKDNGREYVPSVTTPATDDARQWKGWGTALRPSWEPILVARKPLAGTVAKNVLAYGTGALNIDACRVATGDGLSGGAATKGSASHSDGWDRPWKTNPSAVAAHAERVRANVEHAEASGRWPANLVLAHSPSCVQVGERIVPGDPRAGQSPGKRPGGFGDVGADSGDPQPNGTLHGPQAVPVFECAEGCPVAEMDRQTGVRTSGTGAVKRASARDGPRSASLGAESRPEGTPMVSYGDSGGASRFFPVFKYHPKARQDERPELEDGTRHSTVKPVSLMDWLCRLVTPSGGLILDPFAGSGTTAEAAIIGGFRCVLVEKDPKSAELIKVRLSKDIQPDLFGGMAS